MDSLTIKELVCLIISFSAVFSLCYFVISRIIFKMFSIGEKVFSKKNQEASATN